MNSMFTASALFSALFLGSCRKCLECAQSKFNSAEQSLAFAATDSIYYSNGIDTIAIAAAHQITEPPNENCASFPLSPSCTSIGYVTVFHNYTADCPVLDVISLTMEKHNGTWSCSDFEIGNIFFLELNKDFHLANRPGNNYVINVVNNYSFNQTTLNGAQEIVQPQPLGNVSELTRALYHPQWGVLELTYSNPSELWKLLPY